jgi:hypothetical protein
MKLKLLLLQGKKMGQVTTMIAIMLHVNLRYNERGDLLQGYGQIT